LLYKLTGHEIYAAAWRRANRFMRRTVRIDDPADTRGAVKGSFPADGDYGRYELLSWGAKVLVDSLILEMGLDAPGSEPAGKQLHTLAL
jgi:hypothetical protein